MSDQELAEYIPVHGDRLRIRKKIGQRGNEFSKRKNKLLKILHEKLEKRASGRKRPRDSSSDVEEETMRRPYGNKNAAKDTRQIEIGWIHKTYHRYKQVRAKTGGGTRKIMLPKDAMKENIMEEAKRLFFPDGVSPKGPLSKFEFDIWDFSERKFRDNITLNEMYEETKMPLLRFYLSTYEKGTEDISTKQSDPRTTGADSIEVHLNTSKPVIQPDNSYPVVNMAAGTMSVEVPPTRDILSDAMRMSEIPYGDELPDILELQDLGRYVDPPIIPQDLKFKVHRGHLLNELITDFKSVNLERDIISFEIVMPNGNVEIAEDGGGVTRDVLTEFWSSFYEQSTFGTKMKIPCIRHDYGDEEWRAIAKVIIFGWRSQGYFPVLLSKPFIQYCLFGRPNDDLLTAFYDILPEHEANTLKAAVMDYSNVDEEDLLDILSSHECKKLPSQKNVVRILQEIAHKEIIQAPMFVIDSWTPILKDIGISDDQLQNIYKELTPTQKDVCRALCFPDTMNPDEITVSNHLKRFIKELTNENLKKFLRFCTGSDLFICKKISVDFVNVMGLSRRPVAHTCSKLLELSRNYESFPQFRSEFLSVLESNVWVMDIV